MACQFSANVKGALEWELSLWFRGKVQVTLCPNQTWTWWQPLGQQISQEPCPANIFSAPPLPQHTPTLQPRSVILHSRASSIMKPYKPVICCFMACFMKVSGQAALKMVPVTLTKRITTRKGALWWEGWICERMGWGLYVSPASALMGWSLAAGNHWYILRLLPFVRLTLLTFELRSYSHLLSINQLPNRFINQTGWWPVKGFWVCVKICGISLRLLWRRAFTCGVHCEAFGLQQIF